MHGRELLRAKVDELSLTEIAGRIGATRWAVARWIREGVESRTPGIAFILAMHREFKIPPEAWVKSCRRNGKAAQRRVAS